MRSNSVLHFIYDHSLNDFVWKKAWHSSKQLLSGKISKKQQNGIINDVMSYVNIKAWSKLNDIINMLNTFNFYPLRWQLICEISQNSKCHLRVMSLMTPHAENGALYEYANVFENDYLIILKKFNCHHLFVKFIKR